MAKPQKKVVRAISQPEKNFDLSDFKKTSLQFTQSSEQANQNVW